MGKVSAGFTICLLVLTILNILFWVLCRIYTKDSGFEVRLWDFVASTVLYILPNMLMIVSIYTLISLIFKNPLPGVPLLILYMVYSNLGGTNAEEFTDIGANLWQSWYDFRGSFLIRHRPDGALKSKFSYYCIGSNYTDFDTDLEAEANINEEGNEDCSAIL